MDSEECLYYATLVIVLSARVRAYKHFTGKQDILWKCLVCKTSRKLFEVSDLVVSLSM